MMKMKWENAHKTYSFESYKIMKWKDNSKLTISLYHHNDCISVLQKNKTIRIHTGVGKVMHHELLDHAILETKPTICHLQVGDSEKLVR